MNIVMHELGHAVHLLTRWPSRVKAVEIVMHDYFSEAVPIPDQTESFGVGTLAQYLAGSIGERVAMGERDIIRNIFAESDTPFDELCNTPCRSEWDYQVFQTIINFGPVVDRDELARELVLAENLLREFLPQIDLHDVTQSLERDGRMTLTLRDVSVTVH